MNDPVRISEHAEQPLHVTIEQARPDIVVIRLDGDVDLLTAPLLHEQLWPLLVEPDRTLLVDLGGVTFLGSAGLSEFAAASDIAGRSGSRIHLVATARAVLRPLEVTGLHTQFQVFDSIESALREL